MPKPHENEIDIKVLKGQLNVVRVLFGAIMPILAAIVISLGAWVYGQASELRELETTVKFQDKEISKHERKIDQGISHIGKMRQNVLANTIHLENIKKTVDEIADILKKKEK
jgi:hypothetical protein